MKATMMSINDKKNREHTRTIGWDYSNYYIIDSLPIGLGYQLDDQSVVGRTPLISDFTFPPFPTVHLAMTSRHQLIMSTHHGCHRITGGL